MQRRPVIARLVVLLVAVGARATCSRPTDSGEHASVAARVTRWLQDLEADEATAPKAAAGLAALGPADAVAVPA